MANTKYYRFLMLDEDFLFANPYLAKLRRSSGGAAQTIAYIKLMMKAAKNDGYIYLSGIYDSPAEELSELIQESQEDIEILLAFMTHPKVALIEVGDDYIYTPQALDMTGRENLESKARNARRIAQKAREAAAIEGTEQLALPLDDTPAEPAPEPKKKRTVFVPPTVEEVKDYVKEIGATISAEYFVDHYTGNGWMIGRQKMKDWKATVRNWDRRERERHGGAPAASPTQAPATIEAEIYTPIQGEEITWEDFIDD